MKLDPTFSQAISCILPPQEVKSMINAIESTSPVVAVRVNDSKAGEIQNANSVHNSLSTRYSMLDATTFKTPRPCLFTT